MIALRTLIDKSLADVRMTAGMPVRHQLLPVAAFIAEVNVSASLEAQARGIRLTVGTVDPTLMVEVDRDLLFSAIGNLLQNAFKFSTHKLEVSLKAYAVGNRVLIDVEDSCGGLPAGKAESMFTPFTQGARINRVWASACRSAGALSRPITELCEYVTNRVRDAYSRSTCPGVRSPAFSNSAPEPRPQRREWR
jgi:K+-sensing histidine kinase KdpD